MITPDIMPHALRALQRLIVHCKDQAYKGGGSELGKLLNDIELLPECLADDHDRTVELIAIILSIGQAHPNCRYLVAEFKEGALLTTNARIAELARGAATNTMSEHVEESRELEAHVDRVYGLLSRRYDGGAHDVAARHDVHQP